MSGRPSGRARTRRRVATRALAIAVVLAVGLVVPVACVRDDHGKDDRVDERAVRLNQIGTSHLGRQEWTAAVDAFREASRLRPDDPVPRNNLAVARVQQGRVDEAEAALREALARDPDDPYANFNLGLILKSRGEFEAAADCFERVRAHDDRDVFTAFHLGTALIRAGRPDEGEAELRRALELDPDHVSSLYALGRHLLATGRTDEGARLVRASQEIRARSGLDDAVGNQYGEQGPYALGADYPGGGLRAPEAIEVGFAPSAPADHDPGAAVVVHRAGPDSVAVVAVTAGGVVDLLPASGTGSRPQAPDGTVGDAVSGDVDGDRVAEVVALAFAGRAGAGVRVELRSFAAAGPGTSTRPDAPPSALAGDLDRTPDRAAVALVDRDHDGDLDAFACWGGGVRARCVLATNDGAGRFAAVDGDAGIDVEGDRVPVDVAFADVDNDRDVDLIFAATDGVTWWSNQRDGTFREAGGVAVEASGLGGVALADLDKDGFLDLVLATREGVRRAGNRRGAFDAPRPLAGVDGDLGAGPRPSVRVVDLDNDGLIDVVASGGDAPLVAARNLGAGDWAAMPLGGGDGPAPTGVLVGAVDRDLDGDVDLITDDGARAIAWSHRGTPGRHALTVDLVGVRDNAFGVGTKVEVLAGAMRQKLESTGPFPLTVGLGARERVDAVRLLWPGGVLQDEIEPDPGAVARVEQLDRKGTSCPLLYAWRDGRWRFVTDLLGGVAIGYRHGPRTFGVPDTDEYVRIEGGLDEVDGRYRVRLNNQLEEVIWFDAAELVVVDHPVGTRAFANESLMPGPPYRDHELYVAADVRPVARAVVPETGADVTEVLAERDRRTVDGFPSLPFKGYAELHGLVLDLGPVPVDGRVVLLLDGWIDYADSSANVAAHQAGVALVPPRLSVDDGHGRFVEAPGRMGFPAGLPKTMTVDLTGTLTAGAARVRIETSMRIHWDRARVLVGGEDVRFAVTRVPAERAELRFGGFPRETSPDGRPPRGYDPDDVAPNAPFKAHVGRYTAFGDVGGRLSAIDDRFVTTRGGDEIELTFRSPGPVPAGHRRSFLLFADGFGKDMDPNSAAADTVAPIPFHGMPAYPYPPGTAGAVAQGDTRVVPASPDGVHGARPLPLVAGRGR